MSDETQIQIQGGAGPYEAAVIATVIHAALVEEESSRSRRPHGHRPPAWVRAGLPRDIAEVTSPFIPDPGRNWPDD
ncbi:MAG: hypothetical protein R3246_05500 [Acidimicrobiia bacterium]|nr:hypothetical protein [Acidimicrobiia bacterium]